MAIFDLRDEGDRAGRGAFNVGVTMIRRWAEWAIEKTDRSDGPRIAVEAASPREPIQKTEIVLLDHMNVVVHEAVPLGRSRRREPRSAAHGRAATHFE